MKSRRRRIARRKRPDVARLLRGLRSSVVTPIAADAASFGTSRQSNVGRLFRRAASRRSGQIEPLWAESGKVGSAAAPGGAGEALVGQTSSSGVRLSDSSLCAFRQSLAAGAPCAPPASACLCRLPRTLARKSACICLQLRVRGTTFFDTSVRAFLLHSLSLVAGVSAITYGLPIIAAHVPCFVRPSRNDLQRLATSVQPVSGMCLRR